MKAVVLTKPKTIKIEEREYPICGEDEALVRIDAVGICGSDLHFFSDFRIGSAKIEKTRILGHEACGTVVEVGRRVSHIKPGERVALDPTRGCGVCRHCRSGLEHLCDLGAPRFLGNAYTDGVMQEYVAVPASRACPLPKDCPVERACLIEPFSVALHAAGKPSIHYGDRAVILGAGCIGLMLLFALREHGVRDIAVVDLVDARLRKAEGLGASLVLNAGACDVNKRILEYTEGEGMDLVFETAGSSFTQTQTVELLGKGGRIVLVGMSGAPSAPMDLNTLLRKEGTIYTVFRFTTEFLTAARMVCRHGTKLEQVITHRYPCEEAQKAFEDCMEHKDEVIKAVVQFHNTDR